MWVAVDGDALLGTVTVCPAGLAVARDRGRRRGRVPDARGRPGRPGPRASARRWPSWWSSGSARDGARAVVLSSLHEMAGAHRVYERLGFVRAPDRDWSPLPGVDLIAYAWSCDMTELRRPPDLHRHRRRHRRRRRLRQRCRCSAPRGCWRGARPRPARRSTRRCPTARPASAPGSRSSTWPPARSGQEVEVTASTSYVDGRLHRFTVAARHSAATGRSSASGEITRVVVDAERFLCGDCRVSRPVRADLRD